MYLGDQYLVTSSSHPVALGNSGKVLNQCFNISDTCRTAQLYFLVQLNVVFIIDVFSCITLVHYLPIVVSSEYPV